MFGVGNGGNCAVCVLVSVLIVMGFCGSFGCCVGKLVLSKFGLKRGKILSKKMTSREAMIFLEVWSRRRKELYFSEYPMKIDGTVRDSNDPFCFSVGMRTWVRQPKGWKWRMSGLMFHMMWIGVFVLLRDVRVRFLIHTACLTAYSHMFLGNPDCMRIVRAVLMTVLMDRSARAFPLGSYGARNRNLVPSFSIVWCMRLLSYVECPSAIKSLMFLFFCVRMVFRRIRYLE